MNKSVMCHNIDATIHVIPMVSVSYHVQWSTILVLCR